MRKKDKLYFIVSLLIALLVVIIYVCSSNNKNSDIKEENKKQEMENENNTSSPTITPTIELPLAIEERTIENPFAGIDMSVYKESKYENIKTIIPNELYEKMNNKETFILYLGKTQCKWCSIVAPILNDIDYKEIPIYYLNTGYYGENYPENENDPVFLEVKRLHQVLKETAWYSSVPSFRYIENGEVVYGIRNPLPSTYFTEEATEESKQQDKELCKSNIMAFFYDIEEGIENLSIEKQDIWNYLKQELVLKFNDKNPDYVPPIEYQELINQINETKISMETNNEVEIKQ